MKNDITPENSVCPVYLEPLDPAQIEADQAENDAREKAIADEAAAKVKARKAVLDKLGLTADEAAALLS
jgi:hypothetical protein